MLDPPKHTRLRKVLSSILTPDRFLSMEGSVRQRVVDLLAPFEEADTLDLTQDLGAVLPAQVIADLLGIPQRDAPALMEALDFLADHSQGDVFNRTRTGLNRLNEYYDGYLEARKARAPGDDIVWKLLLANENGTLTRDEALGFAVHLTIAGGETTTKLISNMAWLLVRHPDQRRLLVDDPTLIAGAVEETLRYDSSTHMQTRILNQDLELHGQQLRKGQIVALLFNAANNDERKSADPDVYDVQRGATLSDHLAFAGGPHACLGAPLARLETRVVFEELLLRWPEFRIIESSVERHYNPFVKGYSRLR